MKRRKMLLFVVDVLLALLSGVMYSMARVSKSGLCELTCSQLPNVIRVVPCFVLPVEGCSGSELQLSSTHTETAV